MPESRSRKKRSFTPASPAAAKRPKGSARWVAPAMVTFWLIGLIWIVIFYLTVGNDIPVISSLGNWNLLVGMGLIGIGFVFATKWE